MMIVEFLLHRSLPDENPTVVPRERDFSRSLYVPDPILEVLSGNSDINEILWNFSRLRNSGHHLTLKHNPHFYKVLPTSPKKYDGQFRTDPIVTLHQARISVLTDNPGPAGRLFLEIAKEKRAFDNIWVPKEAIIFKGSYLLCSFFSHPNIFVRRLWKARG